MQEVPVPQPGPGEVRLQVKAAGVCLSDVHLISGEIAPLFPQAEVVTLGHEVAGEIESLGEGVTRCAVGDRVVMGGVPRQDAAGNRLTAGVDFDGGWARYVVVPETFVTPLPENIPFEVGAIIPDAVSTPWSAIRHTAQVQPGESVGVWGVGGLGSHAVKLLRMMGAAPIVAVDLAPEARSRAAEYGADVVLDPTAEDFAERMAEATGGEGLDAAFDFAGANAARTQALESLGKQGRMIVVGVAGRPIVVEQDVRFQLLGQQVRGHYGSVPGTVTELVDLITHNRVDFADSITEILPLAEAPTAVEHLEKKIGNPIRIVMRP